MSQEYTLLKTIKDKAEKALQDLITIRRQLHQYPELSFEEHRTSDFIQKKLAEIGFKNIQKVAGTGVIAILRSKNPDSRCIALRADMDALPITEQNKAVYISKHQGVMHACGHDVHTTCLLGAAKILYDLKDQFEGTVKFIFQPGEEKSPGGASLMIKAGVLENPKVDAAFGLHVDPSLPAGTIGFHARQYMASADEIHIRIVGKSGHAALPHLAIDPISISAIIITALQQVVSRKSNPLTPSVLTFGKISGGHTTNVIPAEVELLGTFRTFDESWRQEAKKMIQTTVKNIAEANGAKAEVNFPPGYPSVFNDPKLTEFVKKSAIQILGQGNIRQLPQRMTAEDFAFYGQYIPACFFRLGTNKNGEDFISPVHSNTFDIYEPAMTTGVCMLVILALRPFDGSTYKSPKK